MKKKAFLSVILAVAVAFGAMALGGCNLISPNPDDDPLAGSTGVAVSSVSVTPSTITIKVGETASLSATVLPVDATDKTVTWSTNDPSCVTVERTSGKITGIAVGNTVITAAAGGKSGTCFVTVTSSTPTTTDVPVSSVSVSPSATSIKVNETATLTANVQPANATNNTVSWNTDNPSCVTVGQTTGIITGIAAGKATITAVADGKSGSCEVTVTASTTNPPVENGEISYEYAGNETAAFEWGDSNPASATVQYKLSSASSYTNVDSQLIRAKSSTVARVDIVGLKGGATYDFKITTSTGKALTKTGVKIAAHDRSGYAFHTKSGGQEAVGAYNADGTLKDNAEVIYLTEANKNNVDGKGNSIAQYLGSFQSKKNTKPIVIRVIGTVGSATWNSKTYPGYNKDNPLTAAAFVNNTSGNGTLTLTTDSSKDYTQQQLIDGGFNTLNTNPSTKADPDGSAYKGGTCLPINGLNSKIMCRQDSKTKVWNYDSCWNDCTVYNVENVTIEGIGEDAIIFQWGFTFKTSSSVEVRNLSFDDYTEDACSFEGDSNTNKASSLSDFTYKNIWLHHNTFYEGKNYWDVCDEQDKGDGDGSTDFKGVKNVTIAYNTYVHTHKTNLIGGGDDHTTANVTFHHNYYNACNQRMPLGREANMHMYNNYYSGSTLYSISLRAGAYAFIENCVFTEDASNHYPIELKAGTNKDKVSLNASAKIVNCTIDKSKANNNNKCGDNYLYIGNDRSKVLTSCDNTFAKHFDTNANLFYYKDGKSDVKIMHNTADIQSVIPNVAGVQKRGGTVLDPDNFTSGGGSSTTDPTPSGSPISWLANDLTDGDEFGANGEKKVVDNNLFSVISDDTLQCSVGDTTANGDTVKGVPNTAKPVTVTKQDGSSITFNRGLRQTTTTAAATDANGVNSSTITITAKVKITIRVYVGMSNNNFNSDREHTITYTKTNGSSVTTNKVTNREKVDTIVVTLEANESLVIYGTNYAITPSGKTETTAKLWLFGVEAKPAA